MKILVTGGAGFIGSHVVDRYISDGHSVIVVDDLSTGRSENLSPDAQFHQLDIRSKEAAELIVKEKPEIINHHAAQIDLRRSVKEPLLDAEINILGLINLMEAAVKANSIKKVIFASTGGAIYGDAKVIPTAEDYPAWPVSPYGVAKLTSEHYLNYYQAIHKIPFISLRYGNVYGPRQNPEGEAGVVAIFSQKMMRGEQLIINGDGTQTRDYVYVSDIVDANQAALKREISGIYNIGTGVETDVNTIFKKLAQVLAPDTKEVHGPEKEGEQRRSALNCAKAKSDFDWEAKVTLDEGLKKTAAFFKEK